MQTSLRGATHDRQCGWVVTAETVVAAGLAAGAGTSPASTRFGTPHHRVVGWPRLAQRRRLEMFLEKIESIQVDQSVLGRMFNFGSVIISGTGVHSAPFRNISDPLTLRKNFMMATDARRPV